MGWGAIDTDDISGYSPKHSLLKPILTFAAATLVLGSMFHCEAVLAAADCSWAPAAASTVDAAGGAGGGGRSVSLHSASLRSALHGTLGAPETVSSQAGCRRSGGAFVSMASALLPRSYVDRPLKVRYSMSAVNGTVERESGVDARFGMHWQTMPGPAWVQRVPSWVIQDATTYHRRGLPVLHLWESSNYLVALGLSNHGVPGVYFSQKLP
jgi:hypothetical protein